MEKNLWIKNIKRIKPNVLVFIIIPIGIFLFLGVFGVLNLVGFGKAFNHLYAGYNIEQSNILASQFSDNINLSITLTPPTDNIPQITLEVLSMTGISPTVSPTQRTTNQPVVKVTIKPTAKPTALITRAPTYTPTPTLPLNPGQVGPNCPVSTQNCVPCLVGELYCRVEAGKTTGFKGWACQNNNPGNIRPASFKNDIIRNNGGTPPCGDRSGYMVFTDYNSGRNGLKAYFRGISKGEHSAYKDTVSGIYCGECNLKFVFSKYAPAGDQNDPASYANNVASWIGVNSDTTMLSWIVENKLDQLVDAVQRQEGWFVN